MVYSYFVAKSYSSSEEKSRLSKFTANFKAIMQHNAEQERGLHSYRLGINEYSDLVSVPNANIEMLECPFFTNFNNNR